MIIDGINLNQLRVFECVYRTGSTTRAAQELHLTQSGVSQHIKTLESTLGMELFNRMNKKLIPTSTATLLYNETRKGLFGIEQLLREIKGDKRELRGTVSVGMPAEFGNNCLLTSISSFCRKYPKVRFKITYGLASELNDLLLNGRLDYAFVDEFSLDRRIGTKPVYEEILSLYASVSYIKRKKGFSENSKNLETLDYIAYLEGEPVLRMWFEHHYRNRSIELNTRASGMDVQGVSNLIMSDLGAGILPDHHASKLGKSRKLHRFNGSGRPLKNKISIAYLPERTQSIASETSMKEIISSLN